MVATCTRNGGETWPNKKMQNSRCRLARGRGVEVVNVASGYALTLLTLNSDTTLLTFK